MLNDFLENFGSRATKMREVAFVYRMLNLSEEMESILDEIETLSKSGKFELFINRELDVEDINLLKMLGYKVHRGSSKKGQEEKKVETYIQWGMY